MHSLQLMLLTQVALLVPQGFPNPITPTDHSGQLDDNRYEPQGVIPDYMLQYLANNEAASPHDRADAARTLKYGVRLREASRFYPVGSDKAHQEYDHRMMPSCMHQDFPESRVASNVQREEARPIARTRRLYRELYDLRETTHLPGTLIRKEKQVAAMTEQGTRVWDFYGKTFDFYYENFGRNSLDNLGMSLVGSIRYDDDLYPGHRNAYWFPMQHQAAFGDGDGGTFHSITRSIDVIAHELTHGVVQYTAKLPTRGQIGALNEHYCDVFGSMVKQWISNQTAEQANWLIGEGIFDTNTSALRSIKAPGTAHSDNLWGPDRQVDHMKTYTRLHEYEDDGGVHIYAGIPSKAFYLVATGLGGSSWELAGKIWYDVLIDPALRVFAADPIRNDEECFKFFAKLTVKHAQEYSIPGKNVAAIVKASWHAVGIEVEDQPNNTGNGMRQLACSECQEDGQGII